MYEFQKAKEKILLRNLFLITFMLKRLWTPDQHILRCLELIAHSVSRNVIIKLHSFWKPLGRQEREFQTLEKSR